MQYIESSGESSLKYRCTPQSLIAAGLLVVFCSNGQAASFHQWEDAASANWQMPSAPERSPTQGSIEGVRQPLRRFSENAGNVGPNASPPSDPAPALALESSGATRVPLQRSPVKTGPHTVDVHFAGNEMSWVIGGASYTQASLSLAGENGWLNARYASGEPVRLSTVAAAIPDGEYSYALHVSQDAGPDSAGANAAPCVEFEDPYGGAQCYALGLPERVASRAGSAANDPDLHSGTSQTGSITVQGGVVRPEESALTE